MAKSSSINWVGCGCLFVFIGIPLLNVLSTTAAPIFGILVFCLLGYLAFILVRNRKISTNLDAVMAKLDDKTEVVVFDTETTGLYPEDGDRIIQICLMFFDKDLNIVEDFSVIMNPRRDVGRTDIHGITQGMVRNAPTFDSLSSKFAKVLEGKTLVAHNADFDMRFLVSEFQQSSTPTPKFGKVIDTLALARRHVKGVPNYKLMTLVEHFKIDTTSAPYGRAHDARFDSWCCAEILKRILDDSGLDRSRLLGS